MAEPRECSCCQAKAKFEVEGDHCCGRHLAYVVNMHLSMHSKVAVCRAEK